MYSAAIRSKTVPLPRPCIASLARKPSSARMSCSRIDCALMGAAIARKITSVKMTRGLFIFTQYLGGRGKRTSQEEGLAPAVTWMDERGQAPLPDLFFFRDLKNQYRVAEFVGLVVV